MADAPAGDTWLSAREAAWIAGLRFPKRRSEFRLGRWTAKRALALYLGRDASAGALHSIEIDRAPDGAPLPLVDARPAPAYLTMTDRADQAVCLVGPPGTALGCDLELVEPRSEAFVGDYLTPPSSGSSPRPRAARRATSSPTSCGAARSRRSRCCAPACAATRAASRCRCPRAPRSRVGRRSRVRAVEGKLFPGWWQRFGAFVLTLAATEPFPPPQPLVDPPGLASAVPGESWRA